MSPSGARPALSLTHHRLTRAALTALAATAGLGAVSCMSGRPVQHVGGDSGSGRGTSPAEGAPSHLVCWNVAKADDAIFVSEVEMIMEKIPSGEGVAFCLQEVRSSTYDLIKNLNDGDLSGHYAPSWQYPFAGESTGVLTVSNRLLPRDGVKHLLSPVREFKISSPKVSLLTGVPIGNGDNLQIVNCHGLNFVPAAAFAAQLDDVFGSLEPDRGPAIVCGDFNVWSPERLSILRNKAVTAGLTEAATEKPLASPAPDWLRKIDVFAGFDPDVPFDRVFTRDIEVSHCYAVDDTVSSDHAPIVLRFKAGGPVRPDGRRPRAALDPGAASDNADGVNKFCPTSSQRAARRCQDPPGAPSREEPELAHPAGIPRGALNRLGSKRTPDLDRILSRRDLLPMKKVSYTDARNQLAGLMETASRDREPIVITRNGTGKVVLLAIEEYEAMETTLHLFSTRANASQIQESLADYSARKIQPGELCD